MVKWEVLHSSRLPSADTLVDTVWVPSFDHLAVSSFQKAQLALGSETLSVKCKGLVKSLTWILVPSVLQKLMLTATDERTAASPSTASARTSRIRPRSNATALNSRAEVADELDEPGGGLSGSLPGPMASEPKTSRAVAAVTVTRPRDAPPLEERPPRRVRWRAVPLAAKPRSKRKTVTGPTSSRLPSPKGGTITSIRSFSGVGIAVAFAKNSRAEATASSSILWIRPTAAIASWIRSASKALASKEDTSITGGSVVLVVVLMLVVLVKDMLVELLVSLVAEELVLVAVVWVDVLVEMLLDDVVVLLLVALVDVTVCVVDVLVNELVVPLLVVVDEIVCVVDVLVDELVVPLVVVVDESVWLVDVLVDVMVEVDELVLVADVLLDVLVEDAVVLLLVDVVDETVWLEDVLEDVLVDVVPVVLEVAVVDDVVTVVTVLVELLVDVGKENFAAAMSYIPRWVLPWKAPDVTMSYNVHIQIHMKNMNYWKQTSQLKTHQISCDYVFSTAEPGVSPASTKLPSGS